MTIFDTKMRGKISVCDIFVEKHSNNVPQWLQVGRVKMYKI
jgi:hypothetical protein